jgi:hypothetical protein
MSRKCSGKFWETQDFSGMLSMCGDHSSNARAKRNITTGASGEYGFYYQWKIIFPHDTKKSLP